MVDFWRAVSGVVYDYALTIDSDTLFQSSLNFAHYFTAWSERRRLPVSRIAALAHSFYTKRWFELHSGITRNACTRVGLDASQLPQPTPYLWWNDAPLYERADFEAFYSRLSWPSFRSHLPMEVSGFEHASYVCYKALVQGWQLVESHHMLEEAGSDDQAPYLISLLHYVLVLIWYTWTLTCVDVTTCWSWRYSTTRHMVAI